MNNGQLVELLKQHNDDNLICVRIAGSNKRLKVIDVDDSCDVGMLEVIAEPFENDVNYYSEVKAQAESWNRNTVITKEMIGPTYSVYNGSRFVPVKPTNEDIGKTLLTLAMRK